MDNVEKTSCSSLFGVSLRSGLLSISQQLQRQYLFSCIAIFYIVSIAQLHELRLY